MDPHRLPRRSFLGLVGRGTDPKARLVTDAAIRFVKQEMASTAHLDAWLEDAA
jgi:predicted transcriptional regulator